MHFWLDDINGTTPTVLNPALAQDVKQRDRAGHIAIEDAFWHLVPGCIQDRIRCH